MIQVSNEIDGISIHQWEAAENESDRLEEMQTKEEKEAMSKRVEAIMAEQKIRQGRT